MIGKTISHYKIIGKLGQGGMGEVYEAEDTALKRPVALKFLSSNFIQDIETKQRFMREAQAAAKLNHPNICTIHEIDEVDGQLFIAMELVKGCSLQEMIRSNSIPWQKAIEIAIQICEGLQVAHQYGIVHRDIKSANIMITESGHVKIMDFGLARSFGQTRLTKEGTSLGTVAYMSFEQASGKDLDHRTDIWSLGVVLYEMITGKLPFPGEVDQIVLYSIMNKEPVPIPELIPGSQKQLQQIMIRAVEKNIDKRYQSAAELKKDLKHCLDEEVQSGRIGYSRKKKLLHRHPSLAAAIFTIIILFIGYGLFSLMSDDQHIRSIAVLPLENLSGNPDQVYFVEGMQDALITQLSHISALRVISKKSTMRYAETQKSMPEIARELQVDALLEGSVIREDNQVRITAQLIHGSTDEHIWAKSYDRDLNKVLPLISEIAKTIAQEIKISVSQQEIEKLLPKKEVDIKVHELILRGRYYFDRFQLNQSLEYFQQAVDLDADFAPAYAGVSMSYLVMGFFRWRPATEVIPKARKAALKAIALDENVAGGYANLGYIQLYYDWDWESAKKNLLKALELNPNDVLIRHTYADYLMVMGDLEESLNQVRIGRLYDPLSDIAGTVLDFHRILMRRYDEVIEDGRKAIANNPDVIEYLANYRMALWLRGMYEEAFNAYKKSWGKDEELLKVMEKGFSESGYQGAIYYLAEALAKRVPEYDDYFTLAQFYAQADEPDSALVWLEKAYQFRQPRLLHVKAMPAFDELHTHPGFQDLLRRIGFPGTAEK
jgi:serine/threonine protein kinase